MISLSNPASGPTGCARQVFVSGAFDNPGFPMLRFLEEAAVFGSVHILLADDAAVLAASGSAPKFGAEERRYFLASLRWIDSVSILSADEFSRESLPARFLQIEAAQQRPCTESSGSAPEHARPAWAAAWAVPGHGLLEVDSCAPRLTAQVLAFCREAGLDSIEIDAATASVCPVGRPYLLPPADAIVSDPVRRGAFDPDSENKTALVPGIEPKGHRARPLVVATGTFDWLHTGHVRFFEEAAQRGDLLVMVGNDANIRRLKGEGHPLIGQAERLYMVAAIRHVAFAFIGSGSGWLDAEAEFRILEPDIFVVNADGHKPEKAAFCAELGIRYEVLERRPREGLPARSSTALRGF